MRNNTALFALLLLCGELYAFEVGTHALISKVAHDGSVLSPSNPKSIVPVLGFERLDKISPFAALFQGVFDNVYLDNETPTDPNNASLSSLDFRRRPQEEERKIFRGLLTRGFLVEPNVGAFELTTPAWLMRGSIREDDNDLATYSVGERDEDPWGNHFRAPSHFYDPINNAAYNKPLQCTPATFDCNRSTEWALGRTDLLTGAGMLQQNRRNHFTWQDARNNYWWALTLTKSGTIPTSLQRQTDAYERQVRFATTVKSIGHVIHLLQDAGQPQHTRNDAHGPVASSFATGDAAGAKNGIFEQYTEARVLGLEVTGASASFFDGSFPPADLLPPVKLSGAQPYPIPRFRLPVFYFTTRAVDADVSNRRGLADYSNRGFFTFGTLPKTGAFAFPVRPSVSPATYSTLEVDTGLIAGGQPVLEKLLLASVADSLNPTYDSQSGLLTAFGGKVPLLRAGIFERGFDLIQNPQLAPADIGLVIDENVMRYSADTLIPRTIAYSTGMIDYFFRGRLEIQPNEQRLFGVLDMGTPHTVDPDGYPRRADQRIFGFEKVRLKVRNVTELITESGNLQTFPQTVGTGKLVAVARYHRNACYKPDLSGERAQAYAPTPLIGNITEPTCSVGLPTRTQVQEISVSAPINITGPSDLPGGAGGTLPAALDKVFDFSADPIPVNATDLFIQVVYRGQLGEETDGIAVGIVDVQEPTFYTTWNNTDYYISTLNSAWFIQNSMSIMRRGVDALTLCAGFPSRVIYTYGPANGPALSPFVAQINPEAVRLALILGKPNTPASTFSVRSIPQMFPAPSAITRSVFMPGQQRQASRETFNAADPLPTPVRCQAAQPAAGTSFWCFDPVQRRRGQNMGDGAQPIFYSTGSPNLSDPDVDAPPLPVFPGMPIVSGGVNRFDLDATAVNCPMVQPPSVEKRLLELREEAAELGIDLDKVRLDN